MKKIRTGKILAVVSAIMLLVSAFAVTASAAAPKDGQLFPPFLLGEVQAQYSFWSSSNAAGTDPLKNAERLDSLDVGKMVEYENDNTFNLMIDKKENGTVTRGIIAFTAPADGEYSVAFSAGLWWEGEATAFAIEVYVDGKPVEGSRKVLNAGGWKDYEFSGIKAREGKMISIVPSEAKAEEGGPLAVMKQPLKLTPFKLNFVKSATFEPDTPTPPTPDTSDGIIAAAVTLALCGAAVVIAKKVHR